MADPRSINIVPYHDPYDSPTNYDYLHFMTDSNPTLANFSSIHEEPTSSLHLSGDDIPDHNHLFNDPMTWDIYSESNSNWRQSQGEGQSSQSRSTREAENLRPRCLEDDGMPVSVWPPPLAPFRCTCCHVLREIIHTNGDSSTKLEIHGRLGMICHAIFESRSHINPVSSQSHYHMVDFCKKNISSVKQFLQQYCDDQKKAGYIMVHDPLSIFYEALCVGIEWDENLNNDDLSDPSPTNSGARLADQTAEGQNEAERASKINLAQQRERTGRLTLKDFGAYFHLPIEEAARRMNLCPTVVKKICRRDGMIRWPHRKIKSIQRQISDLTTSSLSNDAEERARAQTEIKKLQDEISNICAGATN